MDLQSILEPIEQYISFIVGLEAFVILLLGISLSMQVREAARMRKTQGIFDDALSIPGLGFVIFDKDDTLLVSNALAKDILPILKQGKSKLYFRDLLDFIYDHADDSINMPMEKISQPLSKLPQATFREIIRSDENRLCLVEARVTGSGRTALIVIDITDQYKQHEQTVGLDIKNKQLASAIQASSDALIVFEDNGGGNLGLVFANTSFCDLMGIKPENLSYLSVFDIYGRFLEGEALERFKGAIDERRDKNVELSSENSGVPTWYNVLVKCVHQESVEKKLIILSFSEITAMKQREAELSQAQKLEALGKLAAGVAHDFNNVLSIIDGYATIALKRTDKDDPVHEYVDKIKNAAKRGASLTRQMLTFGRHKIKIKRSEDLSVLVSSQTDLLKSLLNPSLKLKVDVEERTYVDCMADSISQILMNLVVNARDAISENGLIEISVKKIQADHKVIQLDGIEQGHNYILLCVSDNGSGIPDDIVNNIFDPFFTTKETDKGTGLGLSMVYGLVNEMGGIIDVETSIGQGTSFNIYMPESNKIPERKEMVSTESGDVNLEGYTVLLAEDEDDLREAIASMLEDIGVRVISSTNGNDALLKQDEFEDDIDLLLTDVVMPELDGIKLSEMFKALRPNSKIIYMSGYPSSDAFGAEGMQENAFFMAKPVEFEDLKQALFKTLTLTDEQIRQEIKNGAASWVSGES